MHFTARELGLNSRKHVVLVASILSMSIAGCDVPTPVSISGDGTPLASRVCTELHVRAPPASGHKPRASRWPLPGVEQLHQHHWMIVRVEWRRH